MRWLILFIIISSALGQANNFMQLVSFSKEDETISDGIILNNELFFALTQVDSIAFPAKRSSYIVKLDSSLNLVGKVKITPDTFRQAAIQRLFKLIHPITKEEVIGFVGGCIAMNGSDTTGGLFIGYTKADFSEVKFYDNFFYGKPFYDSLTSLPSYPYSLALETYVINDTTLLIAVKNPVSFGQYSIDLYRLTYDGAGFYIADSIINTPNYYSYNYNKNIFKFTNSPILFSQITEYGQIKYHSVAWQPFLTLGLIKTNNELMSSLRFRAGFPYFVYNDTLFCSVYPRNNFQYNIKLCKFTYDSAQKALQLQDSITIDTMNLRPYDFMTNPTSASYPYMYLVDGDVNEDFDVYGFWWDYEWIHYSFANSSNVVVWQVDMRTLKKNWLLVLGGDAIYDVNGVLAPTDSVVYVYGWRFPFGDTLRHDGDAFVWKISNGVVTSTLGTSPGNVATIFPNPTNDVLKITTAKSYSPTIELYSLEGKLLFRKSYGNANNFELDISNLPGGVYLIRFVAEGFVFEEKVIKK